LHPTQTLFETLACRATLSACDVMKAGADLQKEAHQRHFVAHRFEVQLFEQVARLEPVAVVEVSQRKGEARIVFEGREHAQEL